jgi:hypothetical protein
MTIPMPGQRIPACFIFDLLGSYYSFFVSTNCVCLLLCFSERNIKGAKLPVHVPVCPS